MSGVSQQADFWHIIRTALKPAFRSASRAHSASVEDPRHNVWGGALEATYEQECGYPLLLSFDTLRNGSASGWDVFQLVTGLSQISLTGQSPTQTVFPLQANCVVINFRSHNVYLSGCLIFESVPYLYQGIVSFLDLLKGYHRLEPRISLLNPEPILLFFPDQPGSA